ncbi:Hsp20/alpha crystallin family protein [Limisphaera sp. VF-2]|jgi:HSP20 family protein|uniref:Hsp20/alpha crystallin family protein n=1 Tax=Limisphaera sp. VF-2 TaxID=3400418 RepID=UPI003C24F091
MELNPTAQSGGDAMKGTVISEGRVSRTGARRKWAMPAVNIYETPTEFVIEAEMPGVNRDGLEVTLEGHELTIHGRRVPETVDGRFVLRERDAGLEYRRVFELDPMLDTSRVTARIEQGLLRLTLPKAQELQPRRIPVTD